VVVGPKQKHVVLFQLKLCSTGLGLTLPACDSSGQSVRRGSAKMAGKAAVDKLSAELAFKAQVDAVTRDYICDPHVGEHRSSVGRCLSLVVLSRVTPSTLAYLCSCAWSTSF
jgi:hypothetical protein